MSFLTSLDNLVNKFMKTSAAFKFACLINLCLFLNAAYQLFYVEQSVTYVFFLLFSIGTVCLMFGLASATSFILNCLFVFYAFTWAKVSFIGVPIYYQDIQLMGWNVAEVILHDWRAQTALSALVVCCLLQIIVFRRLVVQAKYRVAKGFALMIVAMAMMPFVISEIKEKHGWAPGATSDSQRVAPTVTAFILSWYGSGRIELEVSPRSADVVTGTSVGKATESDSGLRKINLFFIQYESTFPVEKYFAKYAKPVDSQIINPDGGYSGEMYSPIFGGGSWLAEFSLVTGQTPFAFGPNAFTLQYSLAGSLRSSVGIRSRKAGFVSSVIYPVGGHFINAENFYESIGFDFHSALDLQTNDWAWVLDDRILFAKTKSTLKNNDRNLLFIVTMANHGPHDTRDPFADYTRRLKIQDTKLLEFKTYLAKEYNNYENYIVAYGDHQPAFTRSLTDNKIDLQKTFWSIDCVGKCERFETMTFPTETMGLEFLASFVTSEIGEIPADDLVRAHKFVWDNGCRSLQFDCAQKERNTFNWIHSQFIDHPKLQLNGADAEKP